jgi:hypothetical protein
MADDTRVTYPMMPIKHWWAIRDKFKKSIPSAIAPSYIATAFNMSEDSARANVLPTLRAVGLLDDSWNVNNERAKAWRDDIMYKEVCATVVGELYPPEIIDLASDPSLGPSELARWFSNKTGAGTKAVQRMVSFFLLVMRPDLDAQTKENGTATRAVSKVVTKERVTAAKRVGQADARSAAVKNTTKGSDMNNGGTLPVHINVQIHIAADASADQIDQIFASMAKHLKIGNVE